MGNESSQIEKPAPSQSPSLPEEAQLKDEDAVSNAGSNRTSGTNNTSASRALARDLQQSIMESSQHEVVHESLKKRKKRKSAQSQLSGVEEVPDTQPRATAVSPARSNVVHSDIEDDNDSLASQRNASGEDPSQGDRNTARKQLARELRRLKKTVLVNSGKAKWAPRINGAKWEVEKLPPSQWASRKLTKAEEATLSQYKAKVKDAKRRLKELDREVEVAATGTEANNAEQLSEDEPDAESVKVPVKVVTEKVVEQDANEKDSSNQLQKAAATKPNNRERKRQKKAQRESAPESGVDAEVQENGSLNPSHDKLEPGLGDADERLKKRKRPQQEKITSSPPQLTATAGSRPPLRSVAGKHKTELVKTWLNSQGPQDDMEEASERDVIETDELSRKRKRVSKHQDDDEDDYQAVSQDENDLEAADEDDDLPTFKSTSAHPVKAGRLKAAKGTSSSKQRVQSEGSQVASPRPSAPMSSGPFSAGEKSLADSIFSQVLRSEGIDEATLKQKICTWRSAGTFKEEIEAAFPTRDKGSVRKFCQRRYHMQERGPWTAEQDEDLRTAQANYPDQWRKLQDIVGRTAADCKDRWTKHLQHTKRTGAWSQEEESKLVAAVEKAIDTIKNDSSTAPELAADRAALEHALSWKGIATELGHLRNHKQCREKWEKLKRREDRNTTNLDRKSHRKKSEVAPSRVKKVDAARKKVRTFEIGDFYDIFVEIHTSFDDPSQRYHDEETTLWSIVSQKNMASRFSLSSYGSTLRRVALEHALKEWKIDSKKVRRRLEKSETLPAKAKVLANLLEKSYAGRLHSMSRTYMPDMVGKSEDQILQFKAEKKRSYAERETTTVVATPTNRAKVKSQDYVDDINEDEEAGDDDNKDDTVPATPAIDDDDEEEQSDDSLSEEDQSVCQRRLDAQLNGRQEDQGANSDAKLPPAKIQPRRRSSKPKSSSPESPRESAEQDDEAETDVEDDLVKEEESDDGSNESRKWGPPDPNDPHDAEMLRRFEAAFAEQNKPAPLEYDSDD